MFPERHKTFYAEGAACSPLGLFSPSPTTDAKARRNLEEMRGRVAAGDTTWNLPVLLEAAAPLQTVVRGLRRRLSHHVDPPALVREKRLEPDLGSQHTLT